jgi:catechol 2,3-dioxygenase-like lactoylglutathione lyase family enzyme
MMIGLPGRIYHLEFTTHRNGSNGTSPSRDHLLVFCVPDAGQLACAGQRLEALGHRSVTPENPYWIDKSVTFEDPDGWRIVLCQTAGI